jgi:hypothetical protein
VLSLAPHWHIPHRPRVSRPWIPSINLKRWPFLSQHLSNQVQMSLNINRSERSQSLTWPTDFSHHPAGERSCHLHDFGSFITERDSPMRVLKCSGILSGGVGVGQWGSILVSSDCHLSLRWVPLNVLQGEASYPNETESCAWESIWIKHLYRSCPTR